MVDAIVLHGDLDDYGLDPFEFRLYSHFVRLADQGGACGSLEIMTEDLQMSMDEVREAKAGLEGMKLIQSSSDGDQILEFCLTPRSDWLLPTGVLRPKVVPRVEKRTLLGGVASFEPLVERMSWSAKVEIWQLSMALGKELGADNVPEEILDLGLAISLDKEFQSRLVGG